MHQNAPQLRFLDKMAKQLAVIRSPFQVTHDPFTIASVYNGTPGSLLIHRKLGIFESFFHRHLRRSTQSWLVLTCIMNFAHADFERPVVQPDIRLRNGAPVVYPCGTNIVFLLPRGLGTRLKVCVCTVQIMARLVRRVFGRTSGILQTVL